MILLLWLFSRDVWCACVSTWQRAASPEAEHVVVVQNPGGPDATGKVVPSYVVAEAEGTTYVAPPVPEPEDGLQSSWDRNGSFSEY